VAGACPNNLSEAADLGSNLINGLPVNASLLCVSYLPTESAEQIAGGLSKFAPVVRRSDETHREGRNSNALHGLRKDG
jgi:hypothetical protein